MLQNKFNETQFHLFSCLSVEFFFLENSVEIKTFTYPLKKKNNKILQKKKLPWNMSIKKN